MPPLPFLLGGLAAVGGGGLLTQAFRGRSGAERSAEELANVQRAIALEQFQQTDPLRKRLLALYGAAIGGPQVSPEDQAVLASFQGPEREAIEEQTLAAREALLQNTPARGGQLTAELANLERTRARAIAESSQSLRRGLLGTAGTVAFNAPTVALQGLGGAGSTLTGIASIDAQRRAALGQGFGQLAGKALGGLLKRA